MVHVSFLVSQLLQRSVLSSTCENEYQRFLNACGSVNVRILIYTMINVDMIPRCLRLIHTSKITLLTTLTSCVTRSIGGVPVFNPSSLTMKSMCKTQQIRKNTSALCNLCKWRSNVSQISSNTETAYTWKTSNLSVPMSSARLARMKPASIRVLSVMEISFPAFAIWLERAITISTPITVLNTAWNSVSQAGYLFCRCCLNTILSLKFENETRDPQDFPLTSPLLLLARGQEL